jgi:multimeric flavodoxin WrbA
MDKGNTALILTPFLNGMSKAGAEVDLVYIKKLKINPCEGDFACWLKTPGRCFQKDDMQMLIPKFAKADCWVFATPLYIDGVSGSMKNLLDRMIPLMKPLFELDNGHCCHPLQEEVKGGKVVLVSNCGFWELDNFDPLLAHMKAVSKNFRREFSGALLRPHGGEVKRVMENCVPLDDILEVAQSAGHQLVKVGTISVETLNIIKRDLLPLEQFVQNRNQIIRQHLDGLEKT